MLNAGLLHVTIMALDEHWEPNSTGEAVTNALLETLAFRRTWLQALQAHSDLRNHEATGWILAHLAAHPEPGLDLGLLRAIREKYLYQCRDAVYRDAADIRGRVESAVAFGILRENDRLAHIAKIRAIEANVRTTVHFREHHQQLAEIRESLRRDQGLHIEGVRRRLEGTNIRLRHPEKYARIVEALDRGDILTANEYIDITLSDRELPTSDKSTKPLAEQFLTNIDAIETFLRPKRSEDAKAPHMLQFVQEVRRYARGGPRPKIIESVNLREVAGKPAESVADMLDAWFQLKQEMHPNEVLTGQLLTNLGFDITNITVKTFGRQMQADVTARRVQSKELCPVRQYGSEAYGRYRLLYAWNRPTAEQLLDDVADMGYGPPIIILYFGRMSEPQRRNLAKLCYRRRRTAILIDDILIIFLCQFRPPRLLQLFQTTLPFTFLDPPYTTTASVVPHEVFYGRGHEIQSVTSPGGTSFIFGGRQLGKTALLREVERNVVTLLGNSEDIMSELDRPRDPPLTYNSGTFRSALRVDDGFNLSRRSPLTVQQEFAIADRSNGVLLVCGSAATGLHEIEPFVRQLCGDEFVTRLSGLPDVDAFLTALRAIGSREQYGTYVALVAQGCAWDPTWLEEALRFVEWRRGEMPFVRIVFMANPQTCWRLVSENPATLDTLIGQGLSLLTLTPWADAALRQWIEDVGVGPTSAQGRERLTTVTGNLPLLLQGFYEQSHLEPHRWDRVRQRLELSLGKSEFGRKVAQAIGLDCGPPRRVLRILADLSVMQTDEIVTFAEDERIEPACVHQSLRWAELLGMVERVSSDQWAVRPIVKRVIEFTEDAQ